MVHLAYASFLCGEMKLKGEFASWELANYAEEEEAE